MSIQIRDELAQVARAKILDVASELFFRNGFTQTTIQDIADALGVGKPFLYNYFSGKADILAGVAGRTTAFAAAMARDVVSGEGAPSQRLSRLVYELTLSVIEGRTYLGVMFREEKHLPDAAARALGDNRRAFNAALRQLLEEGAAAGEFAVEDPGVVTEGLTGMTTWIFSWYRPGGRLPPEAVAGQMARMALQLVRAGG
ncbi:TetR/AcrR family transcriptional regulator [Chelatococcus reniformis]|uniref:HTH tetR-type domain-containing protein n=1 Tax=Chelatococcus reniformis TaxID=1494448 RepID=A0A916XCB2_9HYPH|nr:TetR/AcrR family transcriptional regulator [Chelatococcus reniformis]GGC61295.1 hypothetical protein GCM10010994_19820 [Chelatococcus reniformis]